MDSAVKSKVAVGGGLSCQHEARITPGRLEE